MAERGSGSQSWPPPFRLGLLGDLLLRETPLGVNVVLWTLAFVVALAVVLRVVRVPVARGRLWALGPLVVFAALLLWRDSAWLVGLNLSRCSRR